MSNPQTSDLILPFPTDRPNSWALSTHRTGPPSYTSSGAPPSFVSSPPRSVVGYGDDDISTLHHIQQSPTDKRKGPKKLTRQEPTLKPILEDVAVPVTERGRPCPGVTIFTVIIFFCLLITAVLTLVLIHL
jgi:hypothetical protein